MKINSMLLLLFVSLLFTSASFAQTPLPANGESRVTFMLKNTLGYSRMFLAIGPGMAYGFTMSKRQTVPCHWPIGSKLYFSQDGKISTGLILTVSAADEGKTLMTDAGATEVAESKIARQTTPEKKLISIRLRNPGLLPRKVALISYEPGETGNSTNIFTLAPLVGSTSVRFPVGTRLYLADDEQVSTVMSGKSINSGKPFLTVTATDAGKSFNLP